MKIQQQDLFHGAALMQVVEAPKFKALNKAADGKYGHYVLNNDTRLLVKYSTQSGPSFQFSLSTDDVKVIKKDEAAGHRVFVVLVCGKETICPVSSTDLWVVACDTATGAQQIWVRADDGKSMRFGKGGYELTKTIPHNSFPNVVLR
jgi:hypothetical protein